MSADLLSVLPTVAWWMTLAGLIPLAACGVYWVWRWAPPPNAVLLSLGFGVSFLADLVAATLASEGYDTWFLSFLWPPILFAIWWATLTQRPKVRWTGVAVILLAGALSLIQGPRTGLEVVVRGTGAVFMIPLIWTAVGFSRYRIALSLTCLGMLVFALPITLMPRNTNGWAWVYLGNQAVRLVALLLMARAILSPRTLEVVDGHGFAQAALRKSGGLGSPVRGARRTRLAKA